MQPVVVCLVAYTVGMLIGSYLDSGASPTLLWGTPFLCAFLWFLCRARRSAALLFWFLLFLGVGLVRVPLALNAPADTSRLYRYCGPDPVVVEGTVLRVDPRGPEKSSVDLLAHRVSSQGIATAVAGRVRLYLDSARPALLSGDRVRFRSRLRQPRVFGTPGEFDLPRHLAYADIRVTAYLPDAAGLVRLAGGGTGLLRQLTRLRRQSGVLIDRAASAEAAPLVRALALGERGAPPPAQRQQLARAGVAHLFAISGLHMGLLALFGYRILLFGYRRSPRLLRWQPPQRILPLFLLPVLFGYLLLTGDALSTRRAFATCLCLAVFLLWRRRVAPLQLLCSLALSFLLFEPLALWQASFQMSFAGVAGILCWRRYWQADGLPQGRLVRKILQIFLISLAAILATTPLVLLNFHLFTPAGLINNLFAIPLVTLLAVPAGLAGIFLTVCWPSLAVPAFALCGQVLQATVRAAEQVTSLPGLGGTTVYLDPRQLLLLTAAVVILLIPWQRPLWPALLLPLLALFFYAPLNTGRQNLVLTVFSVGQGDAMLLSIDGSRHILIDGGGLYGDRFDVGERLLAPALGRLGVKRLDAVLLTHDDLDHSKGLPYLLEHIPVDAFWCGSGPQALSESLRQVLKRRNIPLRQFSAGWTPVATHGDGALQLYVPELERGSKNDRSVVVYAAQGGDGLLLTGDLERAGTAALLAAELPGPVSLLKLPHHGSRHSDARRLFETLHPQQAFVSVGYQNHFRFPHVEVVAELLRHKARLHRTDWSGTLRFTSEGQGWRVERWRQGLFR